jgi:hypothetical protein
MSAMAAQSISFVRNDHLFHPVPEGAPDGSGDGVSGGGADGASGVVDGVPGAASGVGNGVPGGGPGEASARLLTAIFLIAENGRKTPRSIAPNRPRSFVGFGLAIFNASTNLPQVRQRAFGFWKGPS